MGRALPLVAAVVWVACAHSPSAPAAQAALPPAALASAQAAPVTGAPVATAPLSPTGPVVAQWRVKSRGKGFLELVARIERRDLLQEVLKVHVQLPREITVESGQVDYSLAPAQAPGVDERVIRLKYTAFPEEPLLLTVDAEGDTFTLHATSDYRFAKSKLQDANGRKAGADGPAKSAVAAP